MGEKLELIEKVGRVKQEIAQVVVGQQEVVDFCLAAMLAGGHVLLEGVPGLGKTLLVTTLSQVFNITYNRIQFTPDLMPADITGTNLITPGSDQGFEFKPGPVFANLVLADEINRATPKTQSALLECMQEKRVTVFIRTYPLALPFFVIARTLEMEALPLPEVARSLSLQNSDRLPSIEELKEIVTRTTGDEQVLPRAQMSGGDN